MHRFFAIMAAIVWLSTATSLAQQDTAAVKKDTAAVKAAPADSLRPPAPPPAVKPKTAYKVDTSFEALNLERLYYGMDGPDASYEGSPWDDYLFQDADVRDEDERDQRDQERDSRE